MGYYFLFIDRCPNTSSGVGICLGGIMLSSFFRSINGKMSRKFNKFLHYIIVDILKIIFIR